MKIKTIQKIKTIDKNDSVTLSLDSASNILNKWESRFAVLLIGLPIIFALIFLIVITISESKQAGYGCLCTSLVYLIIGWFIWFIIRDIIELILSNMFWKKETYKLLKSIDDSLKGAEIEH